MAKQGKKKGRNEQPRKGTGALPPTNPNAGLANESGGAITGPNYRTGSSGSKKGGRTKGY